MRKFTIKLLIFISPFILFFVWWEYKLASMPNDFKTKVHRLTNVMNDCEILILGSSHAGNIQPQFLSGKDGVNMGYANQTLRADAKIVAYYLPRMPRLKYVVLLVSYHTLEYPSSVCSIVPNWNIAYHKYYRLTNQHWIDNFDIKNFSMIAWYGLPLSLDYLKRNFDSTIHWGRTEFSREGGKKRVSHFHKDMDEANIADNQATLLKTIQLCKNANVVPILITTPCYSIFRDHLDPQKYERMQKVIHSLCTETGTKYFNHLDDPRFDIHDFSDIDHLNAQGAEKFSKLIDQEVLQPLLKPAPQNETRP